jgi:hypothetical protein
LTGAAFTGDAERLPKPQIETDIIENALAAFRRARVDAELADCEDRWGNGKSRCHANTILGK